MSRATTFSPGRAADGSPRRSPGNYESNPRAALGRTAQGRKQQEQRQASFQWLEHMLNSKNVCLTSEPERRSMVASGISVDYLVTLSESLRNFPVLPTWTQGIVRDVVAVATEEPRCRFVDVIPAEHVGYATLYVCHNWAGDFHDMVSVLATEFNRRWQAYVSYRSKGSKETVDEAAMMDEKRNLMGYYVWIDAFCLNQHVPRTKDLEITARLIHVIGRTALVLEEDCSALGRLWCLFELWCTIKHKAVVVTFSTAPMRASSPSQGNRMGTMGGYMSEGGSAGTSPIPGGARPSPRVIRRSSEGGGSTVLAPIDLDSARTSNPKDRAMLREALQAEVESRAVQSLAVVQRQLYDAVVDAQERETQRARQVSRVYELLTACGKVYAATYLQPTYSGLHSAHSLAQTLTRQCYAEDLRRARLLSGEDVEMELWECIQFLGRMVEQYKEEDYWGQEFKRYGLLAQRSFATRFSNAYVDNLLRQAGTFDNMKVLAQYVHSQCERKPFKKQDSVVDR